MLTPDLQNYITQSRAAGMSDAQIRQNLVAQGWKDLDVSEALGIQVLPSGVKQSKILWTFVIISGILYGIFWGLAKVFGQVGEPIVNIIIFAVRIFYPILGLLLLVLIRHFQKQVSSLPIELFYWCGIGSLLYYSINIFYQGGLNFYLIISLGIAFLTTLIFWLSVRPLPKKRTMILALICFALLGWFIAQTFVIPKIQTQTKAEWAFVNNPDLSLLEDTPYISPKGFQIRVPKGYEWRESRQNFIKRLDKSSGEMFGSAALAISINRETLDKRMSFLGMKSNPYTRTVSFKTLGGLDGILVAGKGGAGTLGQVGYVMAEISSGGNRYLFDSYTVDQRYIDKYAELIGTSVKTFEVTSDSSSVNNTSVSDKPLSDESQTGNQDSNISKNNCGFSISPPKGWAAVGGMTFRNNSLGSEIKLSCKSDGFENNYYVLFTSAQSLMTKPDSGFYVTSAENTMVGSRKAYLFSEEHKTGGVENYELVLMIDSGIKNSSKNQMDIIYAYMPGKYKSQYGAILKEAIYSYKR